MAVRKIKASDFQIDLFDKIDQAISDLDRMKLQVGWFEGTRYDTNTPVAEVAIKNEFGDPINNIPPRPFMRPTIKAQRDNWKKFSSQAAKRIINRKASPDKVLEIMGLSIAGEVRTTIARLDKPALSRKTIEQRLSVRKDKRTIGLLEKPLVFEGLLLNSVSYIVNDGEIVKPFSRYEAP